MLFVSCLKYDSSLSHYIYYLLDALQEAVEASRGIRGHTEQHEDAVSELMRRIITAAFLRTDKEFISPKVRINRAILFVF